MSRCEICEREAETRRVNVEGAAIEACYYCMLGPRQKLAVRKFEVKNKILRPERVLVDDYAFLIKRAMEQRKMKPADLARKLNEKESIILKIEQGRFKPSLELARKIEILFEITLIKAAEN